MFRVEFDFTLRSLAIRLGENELSHKFNDGYWTFEHCVVAWGFAVYDIINDFGSHRYMPFNLTTIDRTKELRAIELHRGKWNVDISDVTLHHPKFTTSRSGPEYTEVKAFRSKSPTTDGLGSVVVSTTDLSGVYLYLDRIINDRKL